MGSLWLRTRATTATQLPKISRWMSLCPLWHKTVSDQKRKGDRSWCWTRQKFFIKQEQGHIKRDKAAVSMPAAASARWMDDNMKMTGPSKGAKIWECVIINALAIFPLKRKNWLLLPLKTLYILPSFLCYVFMHVANLYSLSDMKRY